MSDAVKVALIMVAPGVAALIVNLLNRKIVVDLGLRVDGRLDQLLKTTRQASHAEGVADERASARAGTEAG